MASEASDKKEKENDESIQKKPVRRQQTTDKMMQIWNSFDKVQEPEDLMECNQCLFGIFYEQLTTQMVLSKLNQMVKFIYTVYCIEIFQSKQIMCVSGP